MTDRELWLSSIVEELQRFYEPQPEHPRDAFGFYLWYVLGLRLVEPLQLLDDRRQPGFAVGHAANDTPKTA